jgi:hypothetical protein
MMAVLYYCRFVCGFVVFSKESKLHRMIARIKVCADKDQKEEEEKIFCGGVD